MIVVLLVCLLFIRIYVDLPDAANRMKILKIFLAQENVVPDFQFDELANATEGYSGSDLKVRSIDSIKKNLDRKSNLTYITLLICRIFVLLRRIDPCKNF